MGPQTAQEIRCALLWTLSRRHGWSGWIPVGDLVNLADVDDKKRGRKICREQVASKSYVKFHPGRDEVRVSVPHDALAYDLRDNCQYSEMQIETTLSHFEGF